MGKCQQCGEPTKKSTAKFCSAKCKNNSQRGKREELNPGKEFMCKSTGKRFAGNAKYSGALTRYSKEVLQKEYDTADWELVDVIGGPRWKCPECQDDFAINTGQDSGGWIFKHLNTQHGYDSKSEICEKYPEFERLWPHSLQKEKDEAFKFADDNNRIQCLECGEWFRKITNRHLKDKHDGMTNAEYKMRHPGALIISETTRQRQVEQYFSDNGLSKVNFNSNGQLELNEFIQSLGFETICPAKFSTYDIDVFIPVLNIGFEYDGLFFHSQFRGNHLRHRHVSQVESAERDGRHLIRIFEDEWLNQKDIVKSRITNILGIPAPNKIPARKCEILEIPKKELGVFLNENHLMSSKRLGDVAFGLYYENTLIQCMTFSLLDSGISGYGTHAADIYENVRSCTRIAYHVIGGYERLLKHFENTINPRVLVSYADRRWSSMIKEPVYLRLGFEFAGYTNPAFFGMRNYNRRENRSKFTKQKMQQYDPIKFANLDEFTQESMLNELGFDIIWDCGNLKFIKNYASNPDEIIAKNDNIDIEISDFVRENRKRHYGSDKSNLISCPACGDFFLLKGMSAHIHQTHHDSIEEFVQKYGEYRPAEIDKQLKLKEIGDEFKCLACNEPMISQKQLTQHINKFHENFEVYALKYIFNGVHPKCKCGCGSPVKIIPKKPFHVEFISGHNSHGEFNGMTGKKQSAEAKQKQKDAAKGRFSLEWFIERYGESEGTEKYLDRGYNLSQKSKNRYHA